MSRGRVGFEEGRDALMGCMIPSSGNWLTNLV
jgi:hypothetical protein